MARGRILFMGTPDFAVPILDGLLDDGYDLAAVYCQPPRKAGRGHSLRRSPVQELAERHEVPVCTPASFKNPHDRQRFGEFAADIAVVAAYGLILPPDVLAGPRFGCLNIHASLLPRWRGAAPIQRAIMAGDAVTGISLMQMDAGLDTGAVFCRRQTDIGAACTAGELHDRLAVLGDALLRENLPAILRGDLTAMPQQGETSYAQKIDKSEAEIDWTMPADMIDRQIRGLSPFPGAWFDAGGPRIKVLAAELITEVQGEPGHVLDDKLLIACGRGALRLTKLQRAGKASLPAADFLRGFAIPKRGQLA